MNCKQCKKEIPEDSIFCNHCGKKQITQKKKQARRPGSTGSITYMAGRKKPYRVRLPYTKMGDKLQQPLLGYFENKPDAETALQKALALRQFDKASLTLSDIWLRFKEGEYFSALSEQGQDSHRKAWRHLQCIENVKIRDLSKADFQDVIRNMTYEKKVPIKHPLPDGPKFEMKKTPHGREAKAKVRNLASLLCKEAMGLGVLTINYGQLITLPREDNKEKVIFTTKELKTLWHHTSDNTVKSILILCYTGMRPGELFNMQISQLTLGPPDYFTGGSKTEAGRNRIIPIPEIIKPLLLELIGDRMSGYIVTNAKGGKVDLNNWRSRSFKPLLENLKISPAITPNSCRHTYSTMMTRLGTDPEIMMEIMGHEDYATTAENYNHMTSEDIVRIYNATAKLNKPA